MCTLFIIAFDFVIIIMFYFLHVNLTIFNPYVYYTYHISRFCDIFLSFQLIIRVNINCVINN
jgi:hypothetical protein